MNEKKTLKGEDMIKVSIGKFMSGVKVEGAQPFEVFKRIIDSHLGGL